MQQSSVTAFSREASPAFRRQWLEERSKQAASLVRDFQEWIEAVSIDGEDGPRATAMTNDLAPRYISLIDQTFKELVRPGAMTPAVEQCRADVSDPGGQADAERLKKVA